MGSIPLAISALARSLALPRSARRLHRYTAVRHVPTPLCVCAPFGDVAPRYLLTGLLEVVAEVVTPIENVNALRVEGAVSRYQNWVSVAVGNCVLLKPVDVIGGCCGGHDIAVVRVVVKGLAAAGGVGLVHTQFVRKHTQRLAVKNLAGGAVRHVVAKARQR